MSAFISPQDLISKISTAKPAEAKPAAPASAEAAAGFRTAQDQEKIKADSAANAASMHFQKKPKAKAEGVAPVRRSIRDVKEESQKRAAGGYDAKIVLNSFKVFEPLIAAVTYSPGAEMTESEAGECVKQMLEETIKLVDGLAKLVEIDIYDQDNQWIVANLRAIAASHIGNQWRRTKYMGENRFCADLYLNAFKTVAEGAAVNPDTLDFPDMTDAMRIQLSMMKAIVPVIKEFDMFESFIAVNAVKGFKLDRQSLYREIYELVFTSANDAVNKLEVERDHKGRIIMFQAMLNHSCNLYASAVAYECDKISDHVDSLETIEERDAYIKALITEKPLAVDMGALKQAFDDGFGMLIELASAAPVKFAAAYKKQGPSK